MPATLPPGTRIRPKTDSIVCRMYSQTGKWKEGSRLVIPQTARRAVFFAQVVEVGPGRAIEADENGIATRLKPDIAVGEDILFKRYHGEEVEIGDELYVVLREEDVMARLDLPEEKREEFLRFSGSEDADLDALVAAKIQ